MLLKANKYRKDKKADWRQNELGSRIFMGRVFGDYAECLHFYPSFSYGRIIAGERAGDKAPRLDPLLPAVRAVFGFLGWGQNSALRGGLDPIKRKVPVGQGFPAGTTRK